MIREVTVAVSCVRPTEGHAAYALGLVHGAVGVLSVIACSCRTVSHGYRF